VMLRAVRDFQSGKPPPGLGIKAADYHSYGSWERIVPKTTDWRTFQPHEVRHAAE
jgi:hypothetical protein